MANHCENCGATWSPGTEEHDWQKCFSCGWCPGDPIDDDDDDYLDDEWDDDTDDDDPNDSRNI